MSLIRQNDEHWRDNVLGLTLDARLEREIGLRHGQDIKEQSRRMISESAFVTRLNPQRKILDIAFNCPSDLILDNFGTWLAGLIRQPQTGSTTVTLTDSANSSQNFFTYKSAASATSAFNVSGASASLGTNVKLGSSATAAARANYDVGTAFGTAPESGLFSTNAGSYGSGAISYSGAITAGGADTVREMGWFGAWLNTSDVLKNVMLFHDVLASAFAFVAGDTLNASYSITL